MVFPPQRQLGNFMQRTNNIFPSQGFRQMPTSNNPIGGLLQRFMGSGQNVGQMATRGFGGFQGLSNTLNNVQQILRVVDTAAPIVKQYGPLVKNLPSMYRMMKAFKDMDSTDKTSESNKLESSKLESSELESNKLESNRLESLSSSSFSHDESPVKRTNQGKSIPKLFI